LFCSDGDGGAINIDSLGIDAQSQATFTDVPNDLPFCNIYVYNYPGGSGYLSEFSPEYWGSEELYVRPGETTQFSFFRSSPLIDTVNVTPRKASYFPEDSVVYSVTVVNPEDLDLWINVTVILDRDESAPYDYVMSSGSWIGPGGSTGFPLEFTFGQSGTYYSYVIADARISSERPVGLVTDQWSWGRPIELLDQVGGLIVTVFSYNGTLASALSGSTRVDLFESGEWIDGKSIDGNSRVSWSDLPSGQNYWYSIEVVHYPSWDDEYGMYFEMTGSQWWGESSFTIPSGEILDFRFIKNTPFISDFQYSPCL
jgi:hypothetical protein